MQHLIVGYGYSGYFLAKRLLQRQEKVTAISRSPSLLPQLNGLQHYYQDINQPVNWPDSETIIYYFVPPPTTGLKDTILETFLSLSSFKATQVVYCSSSGVYGDHQGRWIDEQAECRLSHDRQHRRLHAEQLWQQYCLQHGTACLVLRVAGIYGPGRLPVEAAINQEPLIDPEEAPYTSHIYIEDLARIIDLLTQTRPINGIFNVADGNPQPMGALQRLTALQLGKGPAPELPFDQIWQQASVMKKEFMSASKCLLINKLRTTLKQSLMITSLESGIKASLLQERS